MGERSGPGSSLLSAGGRPERYVGRTSAVSRSQNRISTRVAVRVAAAAKLADAAATTRPMVAAFLAAQAQVKVAEQAMASALIELAGELGGVESAAATVGVDLGSVQTLLTRVASERDRE